MGRQHLGKAVKVGPSWRRLRGGGMVRAPAGMAVAIPQRVQELLVIAHIGDVERLRRTSTDDQDVGTSRSVSVVQARG